MSWFNRVLGDEIDNSRDLQYLDDLFAGFERNIASEPVAKKALVNPPKPKKAFVDELPQERNKVAGYTEDRLLDAIQQYSTGKGETKGVVATIDPADFLNATAKGDYLNIINSEAGDIDYQRLINEKQTPFLQVDNGRVIGHEGRHRMAALAKAGYKDVPVIVKQSEYMDTPASKEYGFYSDYNKALRLDNGSANLGHQDGGWKDVNIRNAEPLYYENKDNLLKKYSNKDSDVLFLNSKKKLSTNPLDYINPQAIPQETTQPEMRPVNWDDMTWSERVNDAIYSRLEGAGVDKRLTRKLSEDAGTALSLIGIEGAMDVADFMSGKGDAVSAGFGLLDLIPGVGKGAGAAAKQIKKGFK
jgi:hypothetical protein